MRKNHAGDAAVLLRFEGEQVSIPLAEVRAKKSPHPGSAAFRNGDDDHVATRQFARAAAEIPAPLPEIHERESRPPRRFASISFASSPSRKRDVNASPHPCKTATMAET